MLGAKNRLGVIVLFFWSLKLHGETQPEIGRELFLVDGGEGAHRGKGDTRPQKIFIFDGGGRGWEEEVSLQISLSKHQLH